METLPLDLLIRIAEFLSTKDKSSFVATNSRLRCVLPYLRFDVWVRVSEVVGNAGFHGFEKVIVTSSTRYLPRSAHSLHLTSDIATNESPYRVLRAACNLQHLTHLEIDSINSFGNKNIEIPPQIQTLILADNLRPISIPDDVRRLECNSDVLSGFSVFPKSLTHVICRLIGDFPNLSTTAIQNLWILKHESRVRINAKRLPLGIRHLWLSNNITLINDEKMNWSKMVSFQHYHVHEEVLSTMTHLERLTTLLLLDSNHIPNSVQQLRCLGLDIIQNYPLPNLTELTLINGYILDLALVPNLRRLRMALAETIRNLSTHGCLETLIIGNIDTECEALPAGLKHLEWTMKSPPKLELVTGLTHLCLSYVDQNFVIPDSVRCLKLEFVEEDYIPLPPGLIHFVSYLEMLHCIIIQRKSLNQLRSLYLHPGDYRLNMKRSFKNPIMLENMSFGSGVRSYGLFSTKITLLPPTPSDISTPEADFQSESESESDTIDNLAQAKRNLNEIIDEIEKHEFDNLPQVDVDATTSFPSTVSQIYLADNLPIRITHYWGSIYPLLENFRLIGYDFEVSKF